MRLTRVNVLRQNGYKYRLNRIWQKQRLFGYTICVDSGTRIGGARIDRVFSGTIIGKSVEPFARNTRSSMNWFSGKFFIFFSPFLSFSPSLFDAFKVRQDFQRALKILYTIYLDKPRFMHVPLLLSRLEYASGLFALLS